MDVRSEQEHFTENHLSFLFYFKHFSCWALSLFLSHTFYQFRGISMKFRNPHASIWHLINAHIFRTNQLDAIIDKLYVWFSKWDEFLWCAEREREWNKELIEWKHINTKSWYNSVKFNANFRDWFNQQMNSQTTKQNKTHTQRESERQRKTQHTHEMQPSESKSD